MNIILRASVVFFLLLVAYTGVLIARCNFDNMKRKVNEVDEDFIYVKSHVIEYHGRKDNEKNIYKVLFTSGKLYKISVYDENKIGEKMVVTLYDQKDRELFSNYIPQTKSYFSSMTYDCKQSGVYYIGFHFQEGVPGCGIASLSFKKKK